MPLTLGAKVFACLTLQGCIWPSTRHPRYVESSTATLAIPLVLRDHIAILFAITSGGRAASQLEAESLTGSCQVEAALAR